MIDWQMIVREHGPPAYETAWRILGNAADTDDAVQEAFLDAVRLAREQTIGNWGGMLRRLAACRALDLLRKRRPRNLDVEPHAPLVSQPEAVAVRNELAEQLRDSLAELRRASQRCFRCDILASSPTARSPRRSIYKPAPWPWHCTKRERGSRSC